MKIQNSAPTTNLEPLSKDNQTQDTSSLGETSTQKESFFNPAAIANQAQVLNPNGHGNQTSSLAQDSSQALSVSQGQDDAAAGNPDIDSVNSVAPAAGSEGANNSPWQEGELINLGSGNDYRVSSIQDIAGGQQRVWVERVAIDENGDTQTWETTLPGVNNNFTGEPLPITVEGSLTLNEDGTVEDWAMALVSDKSPQRNRVQAAIYTGESNPNPGYQTISISPTATQVMKVESFVQDIEELRAIANAHANEESDDTQPQVPSELPQVPPVLEHENESDSLPGLPDIETIPNPYEIPSYDG